LFLCAEGKQLAASRDVKFIETSSGIQHNVDELLVGILKQVCARAFNYSGDCGVVSPQPSLIFFSRCAFFNCNQFLLARSLTQIRLKETREKKQSTSKMKSSRTHSSLHIAKEILQKICFNQLDITKSKSCENLHVL
jgi:Rad/Gem-related GTP binding protein 1